MEAHLSEASALRFEVWTQAASVPRCVLNVGMIVHIFILEFWAIKKESSISGAMLIRLQSRTPAA